MYWNLGERLSVYLFHQLQSSEQTVKININEVSLNIACLQVNVNTNFHYLLNN